MPGQTVTQPLETVSQRSAVDPRTWPPVVAVRLEAAIKAFAFVCTLTPKWTVCTEPFARRCSQDLSAISSYCQIRSEFADCVHALSARLADASSRIT